MIEEDKNLRLVLKEFPIFGGDSDYAAKAALASQKQGKYWEFHVAMLGHEGKVTRETVDKIAAEVGLDVARAEDRHGKPGGRGNHPQEPGAGDRPSPSAAPRPSSSTTRWFRAICPRMASWRRSTRCANRAAARSADCPPVLPATLPTSHRTAYKRLSNLGIVAQE